ncbi:hypothetical protein W823_06935 [Williamsia sp. D3]|nr:hypothetical protein W823_06935 [Williamsia sp. D3]
MSVNTEKQQTRTVDVKAFGGKTDGTVELPAEIFDAPANISLMHQVVVAQQGAARQARTPPRLVPRFAVVAQSRTARREPAGLVRVRPGRRSSSVVAPFTDHSRVTTASAPPRR